MKIIRVFVVGALLCFLAQPADAQQDMGVLCKQIVEYVPQVGIAYESDAENSADLNAMSKPIFDSISIPVEIDLAEYFDRSDLRYFNGMMLKPEIANIEINKDGQIFYNGQNITQDMTRACGGDDAAAADGVNDTKPVVEVAPKVVPKPAPAPIRSSVQVFNGPKSIISTRDDKKVDSVGASAKDVPDEKAIDVEVLTEQGSADTDSTADDKPVEDNTLIEGHYP